MQPHSLLGSAELCDLPALFHSLFAHAHLGLSPCDGLTKEMVGHWSYLIVMSVSMLFLLGILSTVFIRSMDRQERKKASALRISALAHKPGKGLSTAKGLSGSNPFYCFLVILFPSASRGTSSHGMRNLLRVKARGRAGLNVNGQCVCAGIASRILGSHCQDVVITALKANPRDSPALSP